MAKCLTARKSIWKKLPQTEFQNLQIEINQTGADGGKEENWDKNEKNKCVRLSFVSHHINCFAVSQLINILSFVCTFFPSLNLFENLVFWLFFEFSLCFRADFCGRRVCDLPTNWCRTEAVQMFFMTPRRVASPRLARRVAFASRWVESKAAPLEISSQQQQQHSQPTATQTATARNDADCDCDWGSNSNW